jgi:UDP-glucose:(heptosyl)LPS alpha-1,3-glucosyltransferase
VRLDATTRDQLRCATRGELGCPADTVLLLFVAAGDWKRKRLAMLLEALAVLDDPRCRLAVVGDDDIAHYQARAAALGIADQVVFCGFQSSLQRWYAAADVFVYPSAYEAFSLVTLEAAGAGLPLVVTATNGTAELVRDGENGVIVEPSAAAIAAALRPLVADPSVRRRMGKAAWASSQRFTREAVAGALLDICASSASAVPAAVEVAR